MHGHKRPSPASKPTATNNFNKAASSSQNLTSSSRTDDVETGNATDRDAKADPHVLNDYVQLDPDLVERFRALKAAGDSTSGSTSSKSSTASNSSPYYSMPPFTAGNAGLDTHDRSPYYSQPPLPTNDDLSRDQNIYANHNAQTNATHAHNVHARHFREPDYEIAAEALSDNDSSYDRLINFTRRQFMESKEELRQVSSNGPSPPPLSTATQQLYAAPNMLDQGHSGDRSANDDGTNGDIPAYAVGYLTDVADDEDSDKKTTTTTTNAKNSLTVDSLFDLLPGAKNRSFSEPNLNLDQVRSVVVLALVTWRELCLPLCRCYVFGL